VADLHVLPAERSEQLVLMVSRYAVRVAVGNHSHHQPQYAGRIGTAVDEVTDEHGTAILMYGVDRPAEVVAGDRVAELREQLLELGTAAVDVADDVERAGPGRSLRSLNSRVRSMLTASISSTVSRT
jgi:hypothetical protein